MSAFGDKVRATAKAHGWTPPTVEQQAARFGCSVEQIRKAYGRNAAQLDEMAAGAEKNHAAGKRTYSGYPATPEQAAEFRAQAARYREIARGAA